MLLYSKKVNNNLLKITEIWRYLQKYIEKQHFLHNLYSYAN